MFENFRIKAFRTVAEQSSFRKASELLNISQPAVSQQVHALEEELRVSLFDRSGNRVRLTPAGMLLLRYARRSAMITAEAMTGLEQLQGEPAGQLRIGASTTVAQYILPKMLARFRHHYPRVAISVISGNTEWAVEALINNEIMVGIIEGPASSPEIHKVRLFEDRMMLILPGVPSTHAWAQWPVIPPEKLPQIPLLMRERGSGSRRVVESALRRAGIRLSSLEIEMELDTTGAIIAGVEAGLGAGFVSTCAVAKELRLETLKAVPIKDLNIVRPITLIRRSGPTPEGAAGAFEQFAVSQIEANAHVRQR